MRHRSSRFVVLLVLALMLALGSITPNISADEVFVGFSKLPGRAEEALVRAFGGKIKYTYRIIPAIAADLPAPAIAQLMANPMVTRIAPNSEVYALDTELDSSWGVKRIGAGAVHAAGNKGAGVKVAVIDTGIDYNHPDLDGNYVCGYNFVNGNNNPMDDHGHGTHVAGIIAAEDDDAGVVGVAPEAELYGLKVLDEFGLGNLFDIIAAMEWATGGADKSKYPGGIPVKTDIINMSLGTNVGNIFFQVACLLAYNQDGALMFASAGNDGNPEGTGNSVDYPAAYNSVIAVAATDQNDERAIWPQPDPEPDKASSTGPQVELSAPGDVVYSTVPEGYTYHSGTSMASPHAAGIAALVWANEPNLTNEEVRIRLQQTADDLGVPGRDDWYGYGIIDAPEAVFPTGPPNNPPVANDDAYNTDEGITLTVSAPGVLGNDTDVEGDPLAAIKVTNPSNGMLNYFNVDGSFQYAPNANFSGSDSFTYKANDGDDDSNIATVTITVNPANDAPVAANDAYSTDEDVTLTVVSASGVLDNDTDAEGDPLTAIKVTNPSNGMLNYFNADGSFQYAPNANFSGSDSFTYKANDGDGDSNIATVTITVNPSVLVAYVSIEMGQQSHKKKAWWKALATVRITSDDSGMNPIAGAEISGYWSGVYTGSASGVSDTNGVCVFQTGWIKESGPVTFTVGTVTKDGQDYPPQETTSDPIEGPASTATVVLAQNHPNPFNPETWIPYGLFKTENVVIRICDSAGRIVRILNLGRKAPGIYMSKEKAAYWDGKNEAGEQVASGVYFYTIQAGDFIATKKMIVAR